MRSMARWTLAGCMALAALGAVSVLDVGAATAEAAPDVSPFAGSWSGTWSDIGFDADGTWDLTISDAGQIKGTVYYIQRDIYGAFVGHVGADGKLTFVGFAPGYEPSNQFNGVSWLGTAVIDGDGKLLVSVDRTSGDISLVAVLERN
jgi:hypothetical protein